MPVSAPGRLPACLYLLMLTEMCSATPEHLEPELITEHATEGHIDLNNGFSQILTRPEVFRRQTYLGNDTTKSTT